MPYLDVTTHRLALRGPEGPYDTIPSEPMDRESLCYYVYEKYDDDKVPLGHVALIRGRTWVFHTYRPILERGTLSELTMLLRKLEEARYAPNART